MRKILILGPSRPRSIGALIAPVLEQAGFETLLASRSGTCGVQCDLTNPTELTARILNYQPNIVIHAAGMLSSHCPIGQITDWAESVALLEAKAIGSAIVLDAAVKCGVKTVIFFAGTDVSSDPTMWLYSLGNGAIWSAVQAAAKHTNLNVFYFELGLVADSQAGEDYLRLCSDPAISSRSVNSTDVARETLAAISGAYPSGSRIHINKGTI